MRRVVGMLQETFGEMFAALDGRPIPRAVDVVFAADALGISRAANRGILTAVERGPVREASLCVTGPAAAEGARAARTLSPDLGIGLHVSLTLGTALTGAIPGLTRVDATFLPLRDVALNCLRGVPDRRLVEAEIRAQLTALREFDISPTHLNGLDFVHVLPVVRDAVLRVVSDGRIRHMRVPLENPRLGARTSAQRFVLARLSAAFLERARQQNRGFCSLPFVGLGLIAAPVHQESFLRIASRLTEPAQEWMVRPRAGCSEDTPSNRGDGTGSPCPEELVTLTCPEVARRLDALGIHPRRFAEVIPADLGALPAIESSERREPYPSRRAASYGLWRAVVGPD